MLVVAALLALVAQDYPWSFVPGPSSMVQEQTEDQGRTQNPELQNPEPENPEPAEFLSEIRIQGNLATSDDEVKRLAGVDIGMPIGPTTPDDVAARLRATRRFERVEVRKRFASISDPSQIVLVIIVDEGPVRIVMTGDPNNPTRVVRSNRPRLLFLPVLDSDDQYGFTYGARLALAETVGTRSRVTFPLTWGGTRSAGVEVEKLYERGFLNRLVFGGSVSRQRNPSFDQNDDRWRAVVIAEHDITPHVRFGGLAAWQHVSFPSTLGTANTPSASFNDSFPQVGAYFIVDTRLDPFLARNAVYVRAAWDRLELSTGGVDRSSIDARGYIGLIGQSILLVRGYRQDADATLPPFLKPLLGGTANLRGFGAGTEAGDTLASGSAELLVPVNSPLSVAKFGVSVYTDVGTAYNKDERFSDQKLLHGYGSGVWFSVAFVRFSVSVAHGVGGSNHVHLGGAVAF